MKAKRNNGKGLREKTTVPVGALVPQPHGGALRNGGTNRGGLGVIPKVARQRALDSWYARVPVAEQIVDNADEKSETRLAAWEKLGKFGLGSEGDRLAAAQFETPDGFKFTLILGERDLGAPHD